MGGTIPGTEGEREREHDAEKIRGSCTVMCYWAGHVPSFRDPMVTQQLCTLDHVHTGRQDGESCFWNGL